MPGRFQTSLVLCLLLFLTVLIYFPALHSGFQADDVYNLNGLSRIASEGYAPFILGGSAGPLGRPISLLTFALQHGSWPDSPIAFKTVNLVIHLVNGFLVFLILRAVADRLGFTPLQARNLCLGATAFWLLHPMHATTVLYVVQRMTQLSALFVLAGVYGFLLGRQQIDRGRLLSGYIAMSAAVMVGTLLATFSKENGILLPLLLLMLEVTLLQAAVVNHGYARWRLLFLMLPAAAVFGWLLWHVPEAGRAFELRPYSMYQKTLTEARVLVDYLVNLIVPHPSAFGLMHDDYPVSRGLLDPPATLAAALAIAGMLIASFSARKAWPILAFGILWFFAGHLLESTHLNLALYFEHRNYVPSIGVMLIIAWLFVRAGRGIAVKGLTLVALAAYSALLGSVTLQNTVLRADPLRMAQVTAGANPASAPAQAQLGNGYIAAGRFGDALSLYRRLEQRFPRDIYPRIKQMAVHACVLGESIPTATWQAVIARGSVAEPAGFDLAAELNTIVRVVVENECDPLDDRRMTELLESLAANPAFRRERSAFYHLASNLSLYQFDLRRAYENIALSVRYLPTVDRRVQMVEILLALKRPAEARKALDDLEQSLRWQPLKRVAHGETLRELQHGIAALQDNE